jgi:exodeoxyribonuclease-5
MNAVMDLTWTRQQEHALERVAAWLKNPDKGTREPGVFRLFGFAGTGKTTLAKHFSQDIDGESIFAAYTGKASDRLALKGCPNVSTIHKMLYCPSSKSAERLRELEKTLEDTKVELAKTLSEEEIKKHAEIMRLENEIGAEIKHLKKPSWKLNTESPLIGAKLLTVDECSMVDQKIGEDLKSFGVPILVLGDPFQLPPLYGEGYFTKGEPDILLTDVQRQAKDNPVLQMATMIREGKELRYGVYGDSKVIAKSQVDRDDFMSADQSLVGLNKTRRNYNFRMREILGRKDPLPVLGDKLVCLRNSSEMPLRNGSLWRVLARQQIDATTIELHAEPLEGNASDLVCTAHTDYFYGKEPPFYQIRDAECFDFGYNITTHKAQGSEWDYVYVWDESYAFRKDARRWLYTAVTRAAKRVTIVM